MLKISSLGYPAVGIADAIRLWRDGAIDDWRLAAMARAIRQSGWSAQRAAGIDAIASGEVGFGDPIAETAAMVGAVPARFGPDGGRATLEDRLALAGIGSEVAPQTAPWAGSHLSYVRPTLRDDHRWRLNSSHPVAEQLEARSFGVISRPVLIGPISFLLHCQTEDGGSPLAYLDRILPAYREILAQLAIHGASWVQIDEPALANTEDDTVINEFVRAYEQLHGLPAKLLVATYGGGVEGTIDALAAAPIDGLHLDLVAALDQLEPVARVWPKDRTLSIGVIDALSPRQTNVGVAVRLVRAAMDLFDAGRLQLAPSRPLTGAPVCLDRAPLDLAPWVETAADKLCLLRRIADAAPTDIDSPDEPIALPDRPDLSPAMLGEQPISA